MIRRLLSVASLLLVVLSQALVAAAQDDTSRSLDDAPATSSEHRVDLAYTVFAPDQHSMEGVGISQGFYGTLDGDAAIFNSYVSGGESAIPAMKDQLETLGWRQSYALYISKVSELDPERWAYDSYHWIIEFDSAASAEKIYGLMNAGNAARGFIEVDERVQAVGDESVFTAWSNDAEQDAEINLLYRFDRFVVEMWIGDFEGNTPEIRDLQKMGLLSWRELDLSIQFPGPALSMKVPRIPERQDVSAGEQYIRRDSNQHIFRNDDPDDFETVRKDYDALDVSDVYQLNAVIPVAGEADSSATLLLTAVNPFNPENGETLYETVTERFETNAPNGEVDVTEVQSAEAHGDASVMYSYSLNDQVGYRAYVLIDHVTYITVVNSPVDVGLDAIESIATQVVECATSTSTTPCDPLSLPAEFDA